MGKKKSDQISSPRVVILYEPKTGKVRHLHYSVAGPKAKLPADSVLKKRALELAERLNGLSAENVRALLVDGAALKPRSQHRVDVKTKRVVSEPLTRQRG